MTYRPRKFAGMDLSARILKVLGDAGRPLTRGELLMHGGNFNNAKATEIQATLDTLVGCGLVAVGREWDERFHREYVTYLSKKEGT